MALFSSLRHATLLFASLGLLLASYTHEQLRALVRGQDVHVRLPEAVSLAVYTRFTDRAQITDGFSGEFLTFYQFLSDWLLNRVGWALGWSPIDVQTYLYVPFLVAALFLGVYMSARRVTGHEGVALLAAILVAVSADPPFARWLYHAFGGPDAPALHFEQLHVPALSLGVATAQALGYVLFVPVLAGVFLAFRSHRPMTALAAGALLGIACLTHTLTFLHLATIVATWLAARAVARDLAVGNRRHALLRLVVIGGALLAVAALSEARGLSMVNYALVWLVFGLAGQRDRKTLVTSALYGGAALLVAAPYLIQIFGNSVSASLFAGLIESKVPFGQLILFFSGLVGLSALALLNLGQGRYGDVILWLGVIVVVSLVLGYDPIFGLTSHLHRFLIALVFGLSLLAALTLALPNGLARGVALFGLLPLVLLGGVRNLYVLWAPLPEPIAQVLGAVTQYNGTADTIHGAGPLLERIAVETSAGETMRLLAPPEYEYPQQTYRTALIVGASAAPAFLPDYRYIVWYDLYARRLDVFCTLFPTYPHAESHYDRRHCAAFAAGRSEDPIRPLDAGLSAGILPVYRATLMPLLNGSHDLLLAEGAERLGMDQIHRQDEASIWRFRPHDDPARLHFGAAAYEEGAMVIPVEAQTSGRYALVLMGTGIAAATGSVRVGETDAVPVAAGPDTILLTTRIDAPGTTIRLPIAPDPRYRYADPTPLFFIAGVERTRLADYFAGPALNGFPE